MKAHYFRHPSRFMSQDYSSTAAAARKHAQERLAELEKEAQRHREILDLEQKLADYLRIEGINTFMKRDLGNTNMIPQGSKEAFYDRVVRKVLFDNGTANTDMFLEAFEKEKEYSVERDALYAYFQRAKKARKILSHPSRYGYYLPGPAFSQRTITVDELPF